jgi:hypothetical protein
LFAGTKNAPILKKNAPIEKLFTGRLRKKQQKRHKFRHLKDVKLAHIRYYIYINA